MPDSDEAPLLGPAPAPSRLVAVGRIHAPQRWLGLERPPPVLLELLRDSLGSAEIAELIDLEQPAEFALGWDPPRSNDDSPPAEEPCADDDCLSPSDTDSPDYWGALSLGLKAWDPAALERHGFTPTSASLVRDNCVATRALGGAPARLICSETRDQLQKLEAYMARGLPLEPLDAAPLYFEFRPQSLRQVWDRDFANLEKTLDNFAGGDGVSPLQLLIPEVELSAALLDMARALLREANAWVHSLDKVALQAAPSAEQGLELTLTVSTNDPQPWLMAAYGRAADAANGTPPAFALLPHEATSGGFSWALQPEDMAPLTAAARSLWQFGQTTLKTYAPTLERRYVDAVDDQVQAILDSPCLTTPSVWANVPERLQDAQQPVTADRRLQALLGHTLIGTSSQGRCAELVSKSLKRLLANKDFERALKEIDPKLRLRQARAPVGLGSKAEAFELSLPASLVEKSDLLEVFEARMWSWFLPDPSGQLMGPVGIVKQAHEPRKTTGPAALTLIIAPGASADWIGFSAAPRRLQELMRGLSSTSAPKALPRPELGRMKAGRVLTGDFFTLEGLDDELDERPSLRALVQSTAGADALRAAFVSTTSVVREGRQMHFRYSVHAPAPTVAALRRCLQLDAARLQALGEELKPSAPSPHE